MRLILRLIAAYCGLLRVRARAGVGGEGDADGGVDLSPRRQAGERPLVRELRGIILVGFYIVEHKNIA